MSNSDPGVSGSWQSVTRAEELGSYLQQISAMPLLRAVANRSMDLLALQPGERVLEVGCGSGVFLPVLAEGVRESGKVIGLDQAPTFVEQARQRTYETQWIQVDQGDACALPYPDQAFDAAHCERVLMHLEDPSAALCEMRRVVRPGGRVVVAEPDWASIIIDCVDHDALEALMRQAMTIRRNPRIGRELNRRLAGVGLTERQIEVVPIFSLDFGELVTYGLDLSQAADALAAAAGLDRRRAQEVIDALERASRDRTFCAFGGYYVARGTVPSSTELD